MKIVWNSYYLLNKLFELSVTFYDLLLILLLRLITILIQSAIKSLHLFFGQVIIF
jgi:hypothetical protein